MTAADHPSLDSEHRYRPEIDGLRALAVAMVILYHARLGAPGGYIGVDVFFVISGYLIGSQIWKEMRAGTFSLLAFWERRARRIMPALLLVAGSTLVAGLLLMLPFDFESLARSAAALSVFAANYHFRKETDYFTDTTDPQPLLHTWSLAVEEQYYLAVPVVLLAMWRVPRWRARGPVLALSVALIAGSLALSVFGVARDKPWAFYDLGARLWELLLGGVLALFPAAQWAGRRLVREAMALLGLALILAPAFLYSATTPFPGLAALPPCIGAALIITANGASLTVVGRALAVRPFVFVGLISYSLYLWHWPLLVLTEYRLGPLSSLQRGALMAGAVVLSIASWRWVETPFRRRRVCVSRRSIFALAGAGLACLFVASRAIVDTGGLADRFSPFVRACDHARNDFPSLGSITAADVTADRLPRIGNPAAGAPVELLIWGDSHAAAASPAFDALCRERGIAGRIISRGGVPPLPGYVRPSRKAEVADSLNDAAMQYIERNRIPNVVLVAFWTPGLPRGTASSAAAIADGTALEAALLAVVERLNRAGVKTWVMLSVPRQPFNVPRALARAAAFGETMPPCARPDAFNGIRGDDPALPQKLAAAGAILIDPRPAFLDETGTFYAVVSGDVVLYKDANHITTAGARRNLLPLLREKFTLESGAK